MSAAKERARYGAEAFTDLKGNLPNPFPRILGPHCMKYLQEVIDSGLTSNMVDRFEKAFARELGVKHCIATPGCTPALAILAAAFGFEPGDEILVSPVTDYGTVQGLIRENVIPVFPDTAPGTVNFSAETIEACITPRTRAILAVHKTGLICDMDPINELARRRGLLVYEDACQAVFGEYRGRLAGTLALAAGFSFDSEKTLGSDVGGCVVTNDDALNERIRFMGHSRGGEMVPHFGRAHTAPGTAHRMTQCTAAICLAQLEIIRPQVARRDRLARLLTARLGEIPGIIPLPIPPEVNVYSCWMAGFSIDPRAFRCDAEDFAAQLVRAGLTGAGLGRYYLMPAALTFLQEKAARRVYPFSQPPASRAHHYGPETCPRARAFLENFIRFTTFCEKYEEEHVDQAAELVRGVASRNRR
ncbi:MAG: aminotransferase class V-fold PLP-dependent enzyme [Planctomycetes bacterium]|nr:aminotransferase class V-fold PLP-dependent enzyme [Planctomycetota bacterium]